MGSLQSATLSGRNLGVLTALGAAFACLKSSFS